MCIIEARFILEGFITRSAEAIEGDLVRGGKIFNNFRNILV